MYAFNRCRREGVSYRPWAERVIELCEGENIAPPERDELHRLYNDNFTYEEAKLYARFKEVRHVWMELHISDSHGKHTERFNNTDSAKAFFAKFPRLRAYLQNQA